MAGTVLILGASGFIGSHLAARFAREGWTVRAGARHPIEARRLAPAHDWVRAEFSELTSPQAWSGLLSGVDLVINCVGVLQASPGDSPTMAHIDGPRALVRACEQQGRTRLIHISAVGAEPTSDTVYGRSKAEAERLVRASGLNWMILRPSLVLARACYGGTTLLRGLAAFPGVIPVFGGDQTFRPIAMDDLTDAVVALTGPSVLSRQTLEIGGPDLVTQADLLKGLRSWLGLPPAPVWSVPGWLAWPAIKAGDFVAALGWPSPFGTTSARQMASGAAGEGAAALTAATGVRPRSFIETLSSDPATTADRWQARLYFVRPASILILGLFWIGTGLITLGPGFEVARQHLVTAGFANDLAWQGTFWGGLFDIAMGLALWVRRWTRTISLGMAAATLGYLVGATLWAPQLWLDPLGPWLKVLPMMMLCLFVASTDDRR